MSVISFKALITGIHIDPVKGTQKLQLIPTSRISIDKLSSLGPQDESIQVTFESVQTGIVPEVFPLVAEGEIAGRKEIGKIPQKEIFDAPNGTAVEKSEEEDEKEDANTK